MVIIALILIEMELALQALRADVDHTIGLDLQLRGKLPKSKTKTFQRQPVTKLAEPVKRRLSQTLQSLKDERKRARCTEDLHSNVALSQFTRFTNEIALKPYTAYLHYLPRLVNVVALAEALPVPGSGVTLPLNLSRVAALCVGAFYAPRRFAAVQLAFSAPRCRVLVFHTGRLVGTGTSGAASARLAILRAQRQLAEEAGIHLYIRNFSVINQVGAVSLRASLNCDAFAASHSGSSHFDRASFVGLAWRPVGEAICCEVYSTGRANLPGSIVEREMIASWARMLPALLRFSSASHLLNHMSEELKSHHAVNPACLHKPKKTVIKEDVDLWAGWADAAAMPLLNGDLNDDGFEDVNLEALGL